MSELIQTEFYNLLIDSSRVTNHEMQQAYEAFVKEVETLNQPEIDYQTVFRSLNLTCIEFQALHTQILYEQGGMGLKSVLSESSLVSPIHDVFAIFLHASYQCSD